MSTSAPDAKPTEGTGAPEGGVEAEGLAGEGHGGGFDPRLLLPLVVILVIVGGAAVLIAGGKTSPTLAGGQVVKGTTFQGLEASPARPAYPLVLHNYMGQQVNIDQYRGKAVLVTFLYTKCPDICPIITSNLRVAQNLMGPKSASRLQIIAVSVDPRGDTPRAVANFLARHGMTGRMQYLVGNAHELSKVWATWGIGSERDAEQPQFINHTGEVFGISATGKLMTLYPGNFKPSQIAHDVPILASS